MNTHAEYRRHHYQRPQPPAPHATADDPHHLATHPDPSLPTVATAAPQPQPGRRVAWVRPTELGSFAAPAIGRGIDLHAELIRRARRMPPTATRSVRRLATRTAPSPATSLARPQEGPQL